MDRDFEKFTKKQKILFVTVLLCVILSGGTLMIWYNYQITEVNVSGNEHYTDEEIRDMVMQGRLGGNSLYLKLKYRKKEIQDIPFIETMDVEVTSPHSITINVYEKALAGYVEYLDRYMYFDKDGIVVESSTMPTEGIPMVTGLKFDHVLLHEKLPVADPDIFKMILGITQLLTKYNISTDKIYFSPDLEVTLYFGKVRAYLGDYDSIDEKVNELRYILPLPEIQGLKGILHMENYTPESGKITFEKDEESGTAPESFPEFKAESVGGEETEEAGTTQEQDAPTETDPETTGGRRTSKIEETEAEAETLEKQGGTSQDGGQAQDSAGPETPQDSAGSESPQDSAGPETP